MRRPAEPRAARISVCGAGVPNAPLEAAAEEVGRLLAQQGAVVICGGLGGVMEAAARGAARAGGTVIGILPGADDSAANPYITIALPTGLGEARNALVARSANALIAIGGEWGTLSEIAFAMKTGVPVVLLAPSLAGDLGLPVASSAQQAVEMALAFARGVM
jgi:uncharacterized protein (TIGR00725 family)